MKDTKEKLFEMMGKLNPDFKIIKEDVDKVWSPGLEKHIDKKDINDAKIWWNSLNDIKKYDFQRKYFPDAMMKYFNDEHIYLIYQKENQI